MQRGSEGNLGPGGPRGPRRGKGRRPRDGNGGSGNMMRDHRGLPGMRDYQTLDDFQKSKAKRKSHLKKNTEKLNEI